MKYASVIILLLIVRESFCQFGAGKSLHVEEDGIGIGIAYCYPFSEIQSDEFSIDFWIFSMKYAGEVGIFLSIATEEDDNLMMIAPYYGLFFKSSTFFKWDRPDNNGIDERQWDHYAFTVSSITGALEIYMNGEKVKYVVNPGEPPLIKTYNRSLPWSIVIGNDQDSVLGGWEEKSHGAGSIDELRFWKTALTQSEIKSIMHKQVTRQSHSNLVAHWPFNEGRGIFSSEVVSNDPKLQFTLATVKNTREQMIHKNTIAIEDALLHDPSIIWTDSLARTQGPGMTLDLAPHTKKLIQIRDLTDVGNYRIISLSKGTILEGSTHNQIPIGSVISTDVFLLADIAINEIVVLIFQANGISQRIDFNYLPPIVAYDFEAMQKEDSLVWDTEILFPPHIKSEGHTYEILIMSLPKRGLLYQKVGRSRENVSKVTEPGYIIGAYVLLHYKAAMNDFGSNYSSFLYKVVDSARRHDQHAVDNLPTHKVTINISPTNDIPRPDKMEHNYATEQGVPLIVEIGSHDDDGEDVIVSIKSLPKNAKLYLLDENNNVIRSLTKSTTGNDEVEMWPIEVVNFSSEWTSDQWSANKSIGRPDQLAHTNNEESWSALTIDGGCIDRGVGAPFYTEFLHWRVNQSTYIKKVYLYSNTGGGHVVGVEAFNPHTSSWTRLYTGETKTPSLLYSIESPFGLCETFFKSSEIRVFFDTCHTKGWNEIDGSLIVGTNDPNTGHISPGEKLLYVPGKSFVGEDVFVFELLDCAGDRFRKSKPLYAVVNVTRTTAHNHLEVLSGKRTDVPLTGEPPFVLLVPPVEGHLVYEGEVLNQLDYIEGFPSYVILKEACKEDGFSDIFSIASGSPTSPAQVFALVNCRNPSSGFSYGIVIGCSIAGVASVIGIFIALKLHQSRQQVGKLRTDGMVAEDCARAIAEMKIDEVDYLHDLEHPSNIQQYFIEIIKSLKVYRCFLPDALLAQLQGDSDDRRWITYPAVSPPGENGHNVAVLFSDIKGSTRIWEVIPHSMKNVLLVHNEVIRELLSKHSGYEVKTIGDAFMVTFECPLQACLCAVNIQLNLQKAHWPRELTEIPMFRRTAIWGGLILRIGICHGEVQTEYNQITGRTDYFGATVNKAARLEKACVPGCVCTSADVLSQVSVSALQKNDIIITSKDPIKLKGVSGMCDIVILLPRELKNRILELIDLDQNLEVNPLVNSTSDRASTKSAVSGGLAAVTKDSIFSTIAKIDTHITDYDMERCNHICTASLESILDALNRTFGTVITAFNTSVLVSWGAVRRTDKHFEKGLYFTGMIHETCSTSIGLVSGTVHSTTIGIQQRFKTVVGRPLVLACYLCEAAHEYNMNALFGNYAKPKSSSHVTDNDIMHFGECAADTQYDDLLSLSKFLRPVDVWSYNHCLMGHSYKVQMVIYQINTAAINNQNRHPDDEEVKNTNWDESHWSLFEDGDYLAMHLTDHGLAVSKKLRETDTHMRNSIIF